MTLLGQLIARGTSLTDIAPKPIQPSVPSNRSNETYSLYCSRCSTSLATWPREGARSRHHAGTTCLSSWFGWEGSPQGKPQGGEGFGGGKQNQKVPRGRCCGIRSPPPCTFCRFSCLLLIRRSQDLCYQVSAAGPVPSPPARGGWKGGWEGSGFTVHGKMLEEGWGRSCPHRSRGRGAAPSSSTAPVPGACSIWGCPTAPLFSRCLSVRR